MDARSFTHVSPEPRRNPEGELGHARVLRFAHNHLLVSSAWAKRVLSPIPSFQALYRAGVGKSLASLQVLRLRKSAEHGFTQYEPGPATGDSVVAGNRDTHPGESGSISGNSDTET